MERVPCTYIFTEIRYEEVGPDKPQDAVVPAATTVGGIEKDRDPLPVHSETTAESHPLVTAEERDPLSFRLEEPTESRPIILTGERDSRPVMADGEFETSDDKMETKKVETTKIESTQTDAMELWVVVGGSGTVEAAGRSWPLRRGQLLLGALRGAAPKPLATARADKRGADSRFADSGGAPEKAALKLYRLGFRALDVRGDALPPDQALPFVGAAEMAPFSFCAERAQRLHEQRDLSGAAAALERQIAFQELLLAAVRRHDERPSSGGEGRSGTSGVPPTPDSREAVKRSVARMENEYREPLTVEALAASAGIGRWAYTQLFKQITGKLPLDYLNEVRIKQAKRLLLATEDRLGEIAQRVGFSSEYYFSRRFKQAAGLSPGRYRRLQRREVRVFAPYLEDALLAIGIVPIAQYSHRAWGVQEYLPLGGVPAFDVADGTREDLSRLNPELLLFDDGFERWSLDRLSGVAPRLMLEQPGEAWADKLRGTAALFGREAAAEEALRRYSETTRESRASLAAVPGGSASRGTVICLRVTARHIMAYAERAGYTGPVLYGALGLRPPEALRRLPDDQRFLSLRPEELAALNADHLFVVFDKSENAFPGEERTLLRHPCWRNLPAVQAGRVYETDFFAWMNYGVLANDRKIRDVMRVLR
ncbi:AraC family transcriptional regulator [Saccharibacillus sacchari]|uniref:AraC family transcriptional regulator n=1 Tax=Saccharibacillus sacchari TaxID=456493 RepID=A0ACC6PAG4_9BACL